MPCYEQDDYVQEHPSDDDINVNCVASWKTQANDDGACGLASILFT
jgi:hypothetical protein